MLEFYLSFHLNLLNNKVAYLKHTQNSKLLTHTLYKMSLFISDIYQRIIKNKLFVEFWTDSDIQLIFLVRRFIYHLILQHTQLATYKKSCNTPKIQSYLYIGFKKWVYVFLISTNTSINPLNLRGDSHSLLVFLYVPRNWGGQMLWNQ